MANKDYYSILGISRSATQDEIKKAYRRLAHTYHPDKGGSGDEEKFKEVNEAYQILGDTDRRARYDQFGASFEGAPPGFDFSEFMARGGGWPGGNFEFNLEDLFGDFFAGTRAGGGRTRASRAQRGRDIAVDLALTLEEAFRGTVKELELRKFVKCPHCSGSGAEAGTAKVSCPACGGTGEVRESQRTFFGVFSQVRMCAKCRGEGEYPDHPCKECGGEGGGGSGETISAPVPAGVDDGSVIKVSGRGEEGGRGARSGDLIIRISLRPHAFLAREGEHLFSTKEISFAQAALGSTVPVETIDGSVELKVPAGTDSDTQFRLKGKGMPKGSGSRGDHYVKIKIHTPKKLSKKARDLLQELDKELGKD